ncbi:MAG: hypothetical protein ABDK94_09460 [Atribacterota bacterium]
MKKLASIILVTFLMGMLCIAGCNTLENTPVSVLRARDWAIEEARNTGIDVPQNVTWNVQNTTPPMLLGYTTYTFTFGRFRIEVGYPVVLSPMYTVVIFENGTPIWEGTVEEQNLP